MSWCTVMCINILSGEMTFAFTSKLSVAFLKAMVVSPRFVFS